MSLCCSTHTNHVNMSCISVLLRSVGAQQYILVRGAPDRLIRPCPNGSIMFIVSFLFVKRGDIKRDCCRLPKNSRAITEMHREEFSIFDSPGASSRNT